VDKFIMSFEFVLSLKRHIALSLTFIVWAQEMRLVEVSLKRQVIIVVEILVVIVAQMTRQMVSLQMVQEDLVIEEVLLAKVAPRVRQNLCAFIGAWIAVVDMVS